MKIHLAAVILGITVLSTLTYCIVNFMDIFFYKSYCAFWYMYLVDMWNDVNRNMDDIKWTVLLE